MLRSFLRFITDPSRFGSVSQEEWFMEKRVVEVLAQSHPSFVVVESAGQDPVISVCQEMISRALDLPKLRLNLITFKRDKYMYLLNPTPKDSPDFHQEIRNSKRFRLARFS